MPYTVTFWGTRGSIPTPGAATARYGGNTPCVAVEGAGGQLVVLDAGTGIRALGLELVTRQNGAARVEILLSHAHWDHIQGIPFFRPLYDSPNGQFFFHSSSRQPNLEQVMAEQMESPYFPVNVDQMRARRQFCNIENGCLDMDGVRIKTAWLNHPQGCLGFRLETKDGVLVYATDNEPGDENFDKAVRKLAEGADILIYDAQYLPEEYAARRRGWGHSHWREAVNIVMESGAKELILYHHDPDHTDAIVDKVVADAQNYYAKVRAAAEGMQIRL